MFKVMLIGMFLVICGCTQQQKFQLLRNYELDSCAMKRMTTSKMNSQAGYLQAHYECEKIVLGRKLIAMDLEKDTIYEPQNVLDENEYCWKKIRSFYSKNHSDNPRKLFIPTKLADIDTDTVKEIREEIADIFNIDKGIDCGVNGLKRIKPALGVEINRRMKKK